MISTRVQFINHSSVLIQTDNSFLLTDPSFQKPAFGSWLPSHLCSSIQLRTYFNRAEARQAIMPHTKCNIAQ
jgi:L-ascorbate metabolism protein UlaG (beta-lactamase superfamily)